MLQLLIVAIVFSVALYYGVSMGTDARARVHAHVTRVVDGDTFHARFADGHDETIRILGIDTPETHHPTKPVGCFGPEAAAFSTRELTGRNIELEYDIVHKDKYGRTLAYVYLNNQRFDDELVRDGYAKILNIAPNNKYANILLALEIDAQKSQRGMWKYCADEN